MTDCITHSVIRLPAVGFMFELSSDIYCPAVKGVNDCPHVSCSRSDEKPILGWVPTQGGHLWGFGRNISHCFLNLINGTDKGSLTYFTNSRRANHRPVTLMVPQCNCRMFNPHWPNGFLILPDNISFLCGRSPLKCLPSNSPHSCTLGYVPPPPYL